MLEGYHPLVQSLLGTGLTWGLTAAGAALVFILQGGKGQRKVLDGSLGFAAGVMLAASYWSLLAPAIEIAKSSGLYGAFTFLPVSFGFALGALFVYMADLLMPILGIQSHSLGVSVPTKPSPVSRRLKQDSISDAEEGEFGDEEITEARSGGRGGGGGGSLRSRGSHGDSSNDGSAAHHRGSWKGAEEGDSNRPIDSVNWRRILLLIVAITVHNIPEGLAVGVGFGAIGTSPTATLESARNLALGIGIQNFPEGLAVSLPLRAAGMSTWTSFWYGQLSGMVEPLAGLLGAAAVVLAQSLLPYALAFAAGAMVFVVVDDIIPESYSSGNGRLSSFGVISGFIVMMSLDVGLA